MYRPGHRVHYIQANKAVADTDNPPEPCRVLQVLDDGTITAIVGGEEITLWNHDASRLRAALHASDDVAELQLRWRLLRVPKPGGFAVFCVSKADSAEHEPCLTEPPSGDLLERLTKAGGFVVRVDHRPAVE